MRVYNRVIAFCLIFISLFLLCSCGLSDEQKQKMSDNEELTKTKLTEFLDEEFPNQYTIQEIKGLTYINGPIPASSVSPYVRAEVLINNNLYTFLYDTYLGVVFWDKYYDSIQSDFRNTVYRELGIEYGYQDEISIGYRFRTDVYEHVLPYGITQLNEVLDNKVYGASILIEYMDTRYDLSKIVADTLFSHSNIDTLTIKNSIKNTIFEGNEGEILDKDIYIYTQRKSDKEDNINIEIEYQHFAYKDLNGFVIKYNDDFVDIAMEKAEPTKNPQSSFTNFPKDIENLKATGDAYKIIVSLVNGVRSENYLSSSPYHEYIVDKYVNSTGGETKIVCKECTLGYLYYNAYTYAGKFLHLSAEKLFSEVPETAKSMDSKYAYDYTFIKYFDIISDKNYETVLTVYKR